MRMWVIALLLVAAVGTAAWSDSAPSLEQQVRAVVTTDAVPRLQTVLQILAEEAQIAPQSAKSRAAEAGIAVEDDVVCVIIEPQDGRPSSLDRTALERFGGRVVAESERLVRVEAPLARLIDIADTVAGIGYVRLPYRPRVAAVSEGVTLIGAGPYHDAGYEGQSVDVAVIDLGFIGFSAAQTAGEFGTIAYTNDYTGSGFEAYTNHGTAVAEIVADVAPQAALHLLRIGDEVDLANAVAYCIGAGIDVIVHSAGWYNVNFYDGTGVVADSANAARDAGAVWVNAAGNEASDGHWQGPFVSADGDQNLDFGVGADFIDLVPDSYDEGIDVTLAGGDVLNAWLTWDDWHYAPEQGSDQDYHLFLINNLGWVVASASDVQDGDDDPTEYLRYTVPPGGGTYELAIINWDAPATPDLELYVYVDSQVSTSFEYHQPASSILAPANSAKVFAVGALGVSDWTTGPIQPYSSRGPTNDSQYSASITKPDVTGPDDVTTLTYGAGAFAGTSAAAPHVAGALALLLSANPSLTASQLEALIEGSAVDMGTAGKDNVYGSGRLSLPPPGTAAAFRVAVGGDVYADGTLRASAFHTGSADVAEWVAVSEPVAPGDVVELDPTDSATVRLSRSACSPLVVGVVSTEPGVVLGQDAASAQRAVLALTGIVPVKVTKEGGPILPGDLLVASSTPGRAMRWAGPDPCPCALVGKALESMSDDAGVILVLLTAH